MYFIVVIPENKLLMPCTPAVKERGGGQYRI